MTPPRLTYTKPSEGWVCFHCGERFTTETGARRHFGPTPDWKPRCIEVNGTHEGLIDDIRTLRLERDEARKDRNRADELADSKASQVAELYRLFPGAMSAWQAWQQFDSVKGRAMAAEAIVEELERCLGKTVVDAARVTVCTPKEPDVDTIGDAVDGRNRE